MFFASVIAGTTMATMCPLTGWLKGLLPFGVGVMTRPDWWGSRASRWWARAILYAALIPVEVTGKENIEEGKSYIFTANHQGAFDIFLVCGYLNAEIRWMMKRSLEKIPFLGWGCRHAGYVFVDKGNAGVTRATYRHAEAVLQNGASLMLFPEGARTYTGEMRPFKKGAFMLADELQLPVVPMTIKGSFEILPRTKDGSFISRHPLTLTIHKPIQPISKGAENVEYLREQCYASIASSLDSVAER